MLTRISTLMIFFLSINTCKAQVGEVNYFMSDANGQPLMWGSNFVADGDPFLCKDYSWADITSYTGKVYKYVRIKYNLINHEVIYLLDDGREMVAGIKIRQLHFLALQDDNGKMSEAILQSNNGFLNDSTAEVYQLIDSGKVSLVKKLTVTFQDQKKYGEAVTTRRFERLDADCLLLPDGSLKKLEKNKTFILGVMMDQQALVAAWLDNNHNRCKSISEIKLVIDYYNSLK